MLFQRDALIDLHTGVLRRHLILSIVLFNVRALA